MSQPRSERPLVLHVRVVTGTGGGPEKTILNSPRFLKTAGYDCALAYLHPPGDPGFATLEDRARQLEAELLSFPDRGLTDLSVVKRLVTLCRERHVTIWHGHDYKSDALGLLVRRFHPMRLVTTVHGWGVTSKKTPLYYAIDRACLKHYERVVCVSDELLGDCLKAGIPADRCCEIENAIDVSAYENLPARDEARRTLNLPSGQFVIGAVGRLSAEKAFDVLIRAVDQLIDSGLPVSLIIAGDGPERSRLEALIRELKREDQIRLTGHVSDPRVVFAALDAFVISSTSEGLPNVLLEAMACGVPVISTAVGGIPKVITDEHDGLLIPSGSEAALVTSLTRLLHNDALRVSLRTAARETIRSRYSFEFRMRKMVALYDELLRRNPQLFHGDHEEHLDLEVQEPCGLVSPQPESLEFHSGLSPVIEPVRSTTLLEPKPAARICSDLLTAPVRVELTASPSAWNEWLGEQGPAGFYQQAAWSRVLQRGLRHQMLCLQAVQGQKLTGVLPLALVQSRLFGRFLVSLPYLNSAGVLADTIEAEHALIDRAIELADQLEVRYLELRHEHPIDHPKLVAGVTDKVHMRLTLPDSADDLWNSIGSKVRNQIRKAQKNETLTAHWGRHEVLAEFYSIFCRNMRDLGTPPFNRRLFESILNEFPDTAEICCIRMNGQPIASGVLIHGPGVTEVPSASSLRAFNATNCNMLLYWNLLTRAIERGQSVFDFGRSSRDSGTYRFKAQWGAVESPAVWQHYVREGRASDMRPNSGKYDLMIRAWQKLPVWLTRLIGPSIVRGIP